MKAIQLTCSSNVAVGVKVHSVTRENRLSSPKYSLPQVLKSRKWRAAKKEHQTVPSVHAAATSVNGAQVPLGRAAPVSTPEIEALLNTLKWDANGLVVATAQHVDTGAVLMQGFADRQAVSATLASRRATFFSRSRKCLWTKGETSGNFIDVIDVFVDCDRDSLLYLGKPDGPTCHTGAETCYYTRLELDGVKENVPIAVPTFVALEETIRQRKAQALAPNNTADASVESKPSWTQRLIQNPKLLCSKIREEAGELCETLEKEEGKQRAASEMADLLFHSMVLLSVQGVDLEEVGAVLRKRFNVSGIEEKASRAPK